MAQWQNVDLSRINHTTRLGILTHVLSKKKVRPRDLGYTPTYIYKVRRGIIKMSDGSLAKLFSYPSPEEISDPLEGCCRLEALSIVKDGIPDYSMVVEYIEQPRAEERACGKAH